MGLFYGGRIVKCVMCGRTLYSSKSKEQRICAFCFAERRNQYSLLRGRTPVHLKITTRRKKVERLVNYPSLTDGA